MSARRSACAMLAIALFFQASSASATADDEACFTAAVDGQRLRNAGKLLDASNRFLVCARPTCPSEVRSDCTRWQGEVLAAQPTIAVGARDRSGADVIGARVVIDGAAESIACDGRAISLDPGAHDLVVSRDGYSAQRDRVVLLSGEKNRQIIVTLSPSVASAPPPPPETRPSFFSTVPTASYALGGVSLVGLSLFGVFGATGLSEYNHAGCSSGCSAGDKKDVDTKFAVADAALVTGIVALGAAVVIWIVTPPRAAARE